MINQEQIRFFLRKTVNKFISSDIAMRLLSLDRKATLDLLVHLETQGFIEKSEVDEEYWVVSIRGKLLANKTFSKMFKIETLHKQLERLLERAVIVNMSTKFPHGIRCMKIISPYPIESRGSRIIIAYTLYRKRLTEKQYNNISYQLRKEFKGIFGNILEEISYPSKAVKLFLQSRSKVLKLREYEPEDLQKLNGHIIFSEDQ